MHGRTSSQLCGFLCGAATLGCVSFNIWLSFGGMLRATARSGRATGLDFTVRRSAATRRERRGMLRPRTRERTCMAFARWRTIALRF